MNSAPWIRLVVVLAVLTGLFLISGVNAESQSEKASPSPSLPVIDSVPKPTTSPTVKTTIAPIHTKEPDIKPPVDQPSANPTGSPPPETPAVRPSVTTATPTPTPVVSGITGPDDNETASTYYQWGLAFEEAGDYEAAVKEYDRAIAREPYFADAWYHKALSLENLGQWDEAYQAYRFLLTIDPGYTAESNSSPGPNSSLSSLPPPRGGPREETPALWIASGAVLAFMIAAGLFLYHRKLPASVQEEGSAPARQAPVAMGPFPDICAIEQDIRPYYTGDSEVLCAVLRLAVEIAREGREGKAVGTAFILGDSDNVLARSRQLILNPLAGHSENQRLITNADMRENIKELSLVDGAFVIRENGIVEAAGRYISIDTSGVRLPKGFGTRHVSVAAITQETKAIGIVVSESGGMVRVFACGKVIVETQ